METVARQLSRKDVDRAETQWAEYQRTHDVSDRIGSAAGIDPETGRIRFGESAIDIADQLDAEGISTLLHFVRVGSATYYRKGGPAASSAPPHAVPVSFSVPTSHRHRLHGSCQ